MDWIKKSINMSQKVIFGCVILILVYFYNSSNNTMLQNVSIESRLNQTLSSNRSFKTPPLILFWTPFFGHDLTQIMPLNHSCPYNCIYSLDQSINSTADARIFHIRDFDYKNLPVENQNALNVYFTLECPVFSSFLYPPENRNSLRDYFNLTITYRSNADIYFPYDGFVELDGNEGEEDKWSEEQIDQHIAKKSKLGLVAISNCAFSGSGRIAYLQSLREYINITQVGICFSSLISCNDTCLNEMIETHHFYFAFENSVCPEYTTEKFWRIKRLIVPVVLSRAAVSPLIPQDSFIAASDFGSQKELATFLTKLMSDKKRYKSYFNWTKHYRRTVYNEHKQIPLCYLCKILVEGKKHTKKFEKEWSQQECIGDYGTRLMKKDKSLFVEEAKMAKLLKKTSMKRLLDRVE